MLAMEYCNVQEFTCPEREEKKQATEASCLASTPTWAQPGSTSTSTGEKICALGVTRPHGRGMAIATLACPVRQEDKLQLSEITLKKWFCFRFGKT